MLKIVSSKRLLINDAGIDIINVDTNFKYCLRIAELFSNTFEGYNAFLYEYKFTDKSTFIFPVVRIKSKLTILNSLPYSWKSAFHYSNDHSLTKKINLILKDIKVDSWAISFPALEHKETFNGFIASSLVHNEVSSYITPLLGRTMEQIFEKDFSSKTRNQCRKALKSGMCISRSTEQKHVEEYYKLYTEASSLWRGDYAPYPFAFFSQLIQLDNVDFWVSCQDGVFLGGIIVLKYDKWVYYWAGMTERKYSSLCANNGLLYEAIKYYCDKGHEYFDFGPSEGLGNVEKFKKGFGPKTIKHHLFKYESVPYKYFLKPLSKIKNRLSLSLFY